MLQRAGVPTAAAEIPLSRMRAKVDNLCEEREAPPQIRRLTYPSVLAIEKAEERAPTDRSCPASSFL